MDIVVSGTRPTGILHLGNYYGAVRNYVRLQQEVENCFFFIADYHALTTHNDPTELKPRVLETVATYLSAGLTPEQLSSVAPEGEQAWAALTRALVEPAPAHARALASARALAQPKESEPLRLLANLALSQQNPGLALHYARLLVAQTPNDEAAHRLRANARFAHKLRAQAEAALGTDTHPTPFTNRLGDAIREVAVAQNSAAELTKSYELGIENDLSKVMVSQQVSTLGFQMTLNVRNKMLSAYKDIMNMPV